MIAYVCKVVGHLIGCITLFLPVYPASLITVNTVASNALSLVRETSRTEDIILSTSIGVHSDHCLILVVFLSVLV
jgi:hypothetical protein